MIDVPLILRVLDVRFSGRINPGARCPNIEILRTIGASFASGKSYLLDSGKGEGAWALSWIIGGVIQPAFGTIICNDVPFDLRDRRRQTWCVRYSMVRPRKFLLREPTVREQVQHGLTKVTPQYLNSEEEILRRFQLTQARYNRPLRQLSTEAWRASCAIGLAHGRKVFCFPYLLSHFIEEHYTLWLKDLLELLKDSGAIVLVPTRERPSSQGLCDEVLSVG